MKIRNASLSANGGMVMADNDIMLHLIKVQLKLTVGHMKQSPDNQWDYILMLLRK